MSTDPDAALRDSEARFRATFHQAAVGVAHVALDGHWVRVNARLCAMLGYTEAELRERNFQSITYPDDLETDLDFMRRLLAGEITTYSMEKRYVQKQGALLWANLTVSLLRSETEAPRNFISIVENISARKQAEAALEKVAEEFRMLAEGIPTLCWMAEPDGHIYWYNRRWYDYTGTTPAQMGGWGWQSVHDPETLPVVLERWRTSIATGTPFEMTFPLRGADQVFRPFLTRIVPVLGADGRVRRWLGTNVDVSEAEAREAALRRSEAALRDSEARLRTATDNARVGLVVVDTDHRYCFSNRAYAEILGLPSFDIVGRRVAEVLAPLYKDQIKPRLDRAFCGERVEYELIKPKEDGNAYFAVTYEPGRDGAGEPIVVVVITDVTDRVRAEAALRDSEAKLRCLNEGLEARVREEIAAREAAQARLVQAEKMTALGQLAGGIAHDFNNVMQAISGSASLIRRRVGDPASVERFAQIVEHAVRRGTSVTRRLLSFARRGELRAERVDVSELLDNLREVLAHTLDPAIAIRIDAARGLPPIMADPGQLETALVNLSANARDAMPAGGTLTFSAAVEDVITINIEHPEGLSPGTYVRLVVADSGVGMDRTTLARALEPFFTTKPKGDGTGLGLPMARSFAVQSGGALGITSAPACGTSVTLWLPAMETTSGTNLSAPLKPARTPKSYAPAESSIPHVLLVDDEDIVRDVLAEQLVDRGYKVTQAVGGRAALTLLDTGEPLDVLISDLSMPGMDGITLIQEVQQRCPTLPAILLTGNAGDVAAFTTGREVKGLFSLLRKPISGSQLADHVAALLEIVTNRTGDLPSV